MNSKDKKDILLFTRPLAPPWDEASKNLAFDIASNASGPFNFHVLTTTDYAKHLRNKQVGSRSAHIVPEPLFNTTCFERYEKFLLASRIFRPRIGAHIIHFLFTPRKLTSDLIRARLWFSKVKTVQTIATVADSTINDPKKLHNVLFADSIVAQSRYTKTKLEKAGMSNVKMIYPGIDMQKFSPTPKNVQLMRQFGIQHNEFVILFAGEYTRLKAIDGIIGAFQQILLEKDPNEHFKLILACRIKSPQDKLKKKKVIEKAKKLDYHRSIVFIDTFSDMPALYNISDINIFPVREMTGKFDIPLALAEAMACKKPVIVSDIPVLEEFIEHGKTGFVISKKSSRQLAQSILAFSRNREKADEIANNAFHYARKHFDIVNTVKKYEDLYKELFTIK